MKMMSDIIAKIRDVGMNYVGASICTESEKESNQYIGMGWACFEIARMLSEKFESESDEE